MGQATMLREQTSVLRTLAGSFDMKDLRHRLLEIAERCDEIAKSMEGNPQAADFSPALPSRDLSRRRTRRSS
jgi:hypothetical protein